LGIGLPLEFVGYLERAVQQFEIALPISELMTVRVRRYSKHPAFVTLYLTESRNPDQAALA
jgi:hypothetical protein